MKFNFDGDEWQPGDRPPILQLHLQQTWYVYAGLLVLAGTWLLTKGLWIVEIPWNLFIRHMEGYL